MTHPNDDEFKKTAPQDTSEGEGSESLFSSSETDTIPEKDAFFTENTVKKKISPLFIFIISAFFVIACLVFGYIYNIGNMRDVGQKYSFPPSAPESIIKDIERIQPDIIKPENPDSIKDKTQNKKDILSNIPKVVEKIPLQHGLGREAYLKHYQAIRNLNSKIDNSEKYLDELVAVKTLFSKIKLPVMTRYSNSGMPMKMDIAKEGMKSIRRAVTLPDMSSGQDFFVKFSNIIRYFVVITPTKTANISEHDGRFALLKQALEKGDLVKAHRFIAKLSQNEQVEFKKVQRYIGDYFVLQKEKQSIDDALFKKLYPDTHKGKE